MALAIVLVAGCIHLASYWQLFDDLFITLRYGHNLVHGIGLRFNPGETVDGFTSAVWVAVAAVVELAGAPADATLKVVCAASGVALAVAACRTLRARTALAGVAIAAVVAVLIASGSWAFWTMTGMETTPFALLVFAATAGLAGDSRRRSWPGLVLGVAALTRPEGAGYAVVLVAAVATFDRRAALRCAALVALVFVPYFAWHWWHFGHPLPNTYYAKSAVNHRVLWRGVVALEEYLTTQMAWLLYAAAAVAAWRRRHQTWLRPYLAVALAAAVNVVVVGGDTFLLYRFNLPALAPLLVLSAVALDELRAIVARRSPHTVLWSALPPLALAIWTFAATLRPPVALLSRHPYPPRHSAGEVAEINRGFVIIGRWLRRTMPPGTVLATNAAGIIPYESELFTIDMLGLNDAHIAHSRVALGHGAIGHEKHDVSYVLARRPDIILLGIPQIFRRPPRTGDELRQVYARWFPFLQGDKKMYVDATFRREYVPRSVEIGPDQWIVLFVRKDRVAELSGDAAPRAGDGVR